MIDAGPLTQEDADEYRIELFDDSASGRAIDDGTLSTPDKVVLTMTNSDALEMAARLLIGAVYNCSDQYDRERAWKQTLHKRMAAVKS